MKRRIYFLLIFALAMIFYTGGAPTEISEKTIVSAIGIDSTEDGYKVTMQVFRPEGSGSQTAVDASLPNVGVVKGRGSDVGEAVKKCQNMLGGEMYIGKNRIILFGKDTDISDCGNMLDCLLSDPECWYKVDCAATDITAQELLEIPVIGGAIASERYVQMIHSAEASGRAMSCTLDELCESMKSEDKALIMPMFCKVKQSGSQAENSGEESEESSEEKLSPASGVELRSSALYRDGRLADTITNEEAGMLAAVTGRSKSISLPDGSTYRVLSREVRGYSKSGDPAFEVRLRLLNTATAERSGDDDKRSKLIADAQQLVNRLNGEVSPTLTDSDMLLKKYFPGYCKKTRHLTNVPVWYIIEI